MTKFNRVKKKKTDHGSDRFLSCFQQGNVFNKRTDRSFMPYEINSQTRSASCLHSFNGSIAARLH